MIVQKKNPEGKDEVVQKSVVSGEDDADLPGRNDEEANDANAARKKKHPDEDEFESESTKSAGSVKPVGQMLCVPADPGGQRTVLVVLVHSGEIAPLRIAAGNFGHAGFEINAKPFPEEKKNASTHGRAVCREAGTKAGRGEKKGDKAGFEEHAVGLITGEVGGGADKGDEANETNKERATRKNVDGEKEGSEEAGPANSHQRVIASGEPKKRGCVPETREADGIDRAQVFDGRENSVGADETADLEEQREKSREVDHAESAEEEPAREKAVARAALGIEEPAEDGSGTKVHDAVPIYRVRRQAPVSSNLLGESNSYVMPSSPEGRRARQPLNAAATRCTP